MSDVPSAQASEEQASSLTVTRDGPYRLSGPAELVDYLGVTLAREVETLLCRCGRSRTKPFCDGSHTASGFTGAKDPRREPDRLEAYRGQLAAVFDNRGLCAHSGFCTDRLNRVFHLGQEPFVTPSGGRLDDILAAVRRCPSGALGVRLDGAGDATLSDPQRPCRIEVSKDGPYRITGAIALLEEDGAPAERPRGASEEHYSLCRCGASLNKPFCSGMHWSAAFADPLPDPDREPTLFEWAGGYPALLDLTRAFYGRYVPADPLIGPLFANMSADHPERVAAWLGEVFGGPDLYSRRYGGYSRMVAEHLGKHIGEDQRARWVSLMGRAANDMGLPADPEFRAAFVAYLEWGSRIAVENASEAARPPPNMPVPKWWWVCEARPGSRISALAGAADTAAAPALPGPDEPLVFDLHIRPLFRALDRNSMRFAFDLWNEADVRAHGAGILARLRAGTMPCDGAWSAAWISAFERWLTTTSTDA